MLSMFKDWQGKVSVNDVDYDNISQVNKPVSGPIHIILYPEQYNVRETGSRKAQVEDLIDEKELLITVKQYMTKKAEPNFDFMEKWNNNNPMPMRIMAGTVIQETRGMVKMKLHGTMYAEKMCTCMVCGKKLTNPVSQYFGVGPECGGHNYVHPFDTDEELKQAVSEYRRKLQDVTWEGWIIKSAIIEQEEI